MKLKVLVDNNTYIDMYYLGEPALSFYLEDGRDRILFDTGYSDAFMINARKMALELKTVNKVVISHGHNDHTGGLRHLLEINRWATIITHPDSFLYRQDDEGLAISSPLNRMDLEEKASLQLSREPAAVSEHLTYLGEIPQYLDFEPRYRIGRSLIKGELQDDYIYDDSALVYRGKDGLFVITGCSHSGICNIIEHAKKICHEDRIVGVIGGFHLFEVDERLHKTIEYLKDNQIPLLYPCHCVSLKAKVEMGKQLNIQEVGVGLNLDIE
ncbi:MAG: MBL fold metallo-hydrolase [Erysipelotrichaceae bacterium]|nr:MBL fold metallo-hydrolase [Erysipelotrichaceae bacterium]